MYNVAVAFFTPELLFKLVIYNGVGVKKNSCKMYEATAR